MRQIGQQHPGLDEGFLGRMYRASLLTAGLAALIVALYGHLPWAAGLGLAGLWSVANLWALARLLKLVAVPGPKNLPAVLLALSIKLVVLYGSGALLVIFGGFPPLSLVVGFSVPLAVVVLKVLSLLLFARDPSGPKRGPQT